MSGVESCPVTSQASAESRATSAASQIQTALAPPASGRVTAGRDRSSRRSCVFAQAPTFGDCEVTLVWHIRQGRYGDVVLDGLNVLGLGAFTGNIWSGETRMSFGVFFDERADEGHRVRPWRVHQPYPAPFSGAWVGLFQR